MPGKEMSRGEKKIPPSRATDIYFKLDKLLLHTYKISHYMVQRELK